MNARATGRFLSVLLWLLFVTGCGITDAPPPDPDRFINMSVVAGGEQVGLPNSQLTDPLQIRLISNVTDEPIRGREVHFSASAASGIVFTPARAVTDTNGIARTQVRLGSAVGRHTVQVNFDGNPGAPTSTTIETALLPVVAQVTPSATTAGGQVVITGENFSPTAALNDVVIDGTLAQVISATSTRIDARLSNCIPTRTASLTIQRGALQSAPVQISVTASAGATVDPVRGQVLTVNDANGLGCVRIAPQQSAAEYLVITHQGASTGTKSVPLRLTGLAHGSGGTVAQLKPVVVPADFPVVPDAVSTFRQQMHERGAQIIRRMRPRPQLSEQAVTATTVPVVGEKRSFRVFVPRQPAATITAEARVVGRYIAIFEDTTAAGSISQANLESVLALLEDPIYATDVAVFGGVSDLDRNDRVIVLLTPGVNRLTGANETSFINGYFDYCDLVDVNECPDTNRSEIMYSVVPDPNGRWGLKHTEQNIVRLLPPLIAHELEHLIHFNQRALVGGVRTHEDLWLSEAMAHFAEDTVAGVLRARGLAAEADGFLRENLVRATFFLRAPDKTSLIASSGQGSLEERGAGWLFVKYLHHRLGASVLRRLVTSPETGVRSVTNVANASWMTLLRDWSVALYAASDPALSDVTFSREQSLGGFDLRGALATVSSSGFPLQPTPLTGNGFSVEWKLAPSATTFSKLSIAPGAAINLIMSGARGGAFDTSAQPQMLLLKIR
jgi:hypothetical protein